MKKIFPVYMILLGMATAASAATIGDKAGTTTGEFLRLGAGARGVAMGKPTRH